MRKAILHWLFSGDAKSLEDVLKIAAECNETSKKTLEGEKRLFERYSNLLDREKLIIEAIFDSTDYRLMARVIDILNSGKGVGENETL